jgi:hypothetical protein
VGRDDQLAAAHAAVERGDWERALTLLDEAGPSSETAEGLALRARAAYAAGRFEESVSACGDGCAVPSACSTPRHPRMP